MITRYYRLPILLLASLAVAALAFAGVPQTINYQGYLKDGAGAPVSTATNVRFALYSSTPTRSNPLWQETRSVTPANGIYSVQLGAQTPITAPFDVPYFLGVKVGGDDEMALQPLGSSGYAFRAGTVADGSISNSAISGTIANDKLDLSTVVKKAGDSMSGPLSIASATGSPLSATATGTSGHAGTFQVSNATSGYNAINAASNGTGATIYATAGGDAPAGNFEASGSGATLRGVTFGTGSAGMFLINNATNNQAALSANTSGLGFSASFSVSNPNNQSPVLRAYNSGAGTAASLYTSRTDNTASVLDVSGSGTGSAGSFLALNTTSGAPAVQAETVGVGNAGRFTITNAQSSADALYVSTSGSGRAANFVGNVQVNGDVNISGALTPTSITLPDNSITDAKISGTISGSKLGQHNHNGAEITSGTIADGRLSANVELLNAAQTVSGTKTFSAAPSFSAVSGAPFSVASSALVANLNAESIGGNKLADLDNRYSSRLLQAPPVQNPRTNTISSYDYSGGQYSSITVGADGLPIISYHSFWDSGDKCLKVAKCVDAACTTASISKLDHSASGLIGQYSSIAIGTDNLPIISYYDAVNGDLKVAKCGNPECSSASYTTLDGADADVGKYTSLAIGTDGLPVISYYDVTNGGLKVAKCSDVSCSGATVRTLESGANIGKYTSLAIGTDGLPVISYVDSGNSILKVAKCAAADCNGTPLITNMTSASNFGESTSIAIGADGNPVIASYSYNAVVVCKCTSPNCSSKTGPSTLAGGSGVGRFVSLTIPADGLPIVSYSDSGRLAVVKCSNANCTTAASAATVDNTDNPGEYSSITIGMDGLPVISYYEGYLARLRVVKCANQFCMNNWSRR